MYPGGNARDFITLGMPDMAVRESLGQRERRSSWLQFGDADGHLGAMGPCSGRTIIKAFLPIGAIRTVLTRGEHGTEYSGQALAELLEARSAFLRISLRPRTDRTEL